MTRKVLENCHRSGREVELRKVDAIHRMAIAIGTEAARTAFRVSLEAHSLRALRLEH